MNKAITHIRKDYGQKVAIVAKTKPKRHTTVQIHQVNSVKGNISPLSKISSKYHSTTHRERG